MCRDIHPTNVNHDAAKMIVRVKFSPPINHSQQSRLAISIVNVNKSHDISADTRLLAHNAL